MRGRYESNAHRNGRTLVVKPLILQARNSRPPCYHEGCYERNSPSNSKLPEGRFKFLGSCNGLFRFCAKLYRVIIWNPSSNGNLKTTPNVWQLGYKSIFGLGNNEHNDDYKVVYAYYADNGDENVVLVYSFKHGTWKRIEREFSSGFVNPIVVVFVSATTT
nr:F-box/kelch-repeat protein At3g23880-like [Ipomoea batatas]